MDTTTRIPAPFAGHPEAAAHLVELGGGRRLLRIVSDIIRNIRLWQLRAHPAPAETEKSEIPLDIFIPAVEKDLDVLPHVIDSARKNVLHDIGEIFVVSPDSAAIRHLCDRMRCTNVLEDTLLPVGKKDIHYTVNGVDRSGWLYQQLLKLSADRLSSKKQILILDADTLIIRPQTFVSQGVTTFNCSDQYHPPYLTAYRKLLNERPTAPVSFVSHHMLFDRGRLDELRRQIASCCRRTWYEAILENADQTDQAGFSEYETYGNFMYARYRREMRLEYCFNRRLKGKDLQNFHNLNMARLSKNFKSVSFHSYHR